MFESASIGQNISAPPQAAVLFKNNQWNHEIESASAKLQEGEAKAIKEKVGIILNLVGELTRDITSNKLTSTDAKKVCQEIMFLAGCYRVRGYPGIKSSLNDLSSLYHQHYNATKVQPSNTFHVSEVNAMA